MSQAQANEAKVESITDADVWQAIVDGVNEIGMGESVFVFTPDGFETVLKDPGNVALIRQTIDADDFDHFDVEGKFTSGVNAETFDDLLTAIDDVPVSWGWDWDKYRWSFEAGDVDYDMAGIQADTVSGSPAEVPPVKDDLPYTVDVTIPVDKFERASKIVDMNSSVATFRMGGEHEVFVIEGHGDDDAARIRIHEDDAFEWNEDPPESEEISVQSNAYMQKVAKLLDEDTVRIVTGPEVPYHLWTTREGVIDTKIMQAPRVDINK